MKTIIKIAFFTILLATMSHPVAFSAQPDAESFDLEVTLATPYNHDFTMQTTLCVEQSFELLATNGGITNTVSGILHAPTNGVYPLDLTVSEWKSDKSNISDTTTLKLELGKMSGYGTVSSFLYNGFVTLRKHESHLTPR